MPATLTPATAPRAYYEQPAPWWIMRAASSRAERIWWIVFASAGIAALALTWYRLSFGTGGHDESYYFVSSERLLNGARPFKDVWEPMLAGYLYSPVVFVHDALVGSTDGIILTLRRTYFLFVLAAVFACFLILRTRFGRQGAAIALAPLCVVAPWSLYTFSYNTLGIFTVLLSGYFAFAALHAPVIAARTLSFLSGLMIGLAIVAYPSIGMNVVVIGAALYMLKRSEGRPAEAMHLLLRYVVGAALIGAVLVAFFVSTTGGIAELYSAIRSLLAYKGYEPKGIYDLASAQTDVPPDLRQFVTGISQLRSFVS